MRVFILILYILSSLLINSLAISPEDDKFLDELERSAFLFFWEQANATTGQVKDRAFANGTEDNRPISSIAATGFGLTALVIAHNRNYHDKSAIEERIKNTLNFIWEKLDGHKGFFYHFVDMNTGERVWNCELSSIDTSLLINGVLMVKAYFNQDQFIQKIASDIYNRVDYKWMLNEKKVLSMGWMPESGFLGDSWNRYCELLMLVLQAIGSPTHSIPNEYWNEFRRDKYTYKNYTFITVADGAPLFVHQFSHAWYDFQNKHDRYTDYYENSVIATKAHKLWMVTDMADKFPIYSDKYWGITASDTIGGYMAWGGPPIQGPIDGSIVPCAAAGSIPFLPNETIAVLKSIKEMYPLSWGRYGFLDAFNPTNNWYNPDVIGIDVGITMLMAENYRTKFVWNTFIKNDLVVKSMELAGFKENSCSTLYLENYIHFTVLLTILLNFYK